MSILDSDSSTPSPSTDLNNNVSMKLPPLPLRRLPRRLRTYSTSSPDPYNAFLSRSPVLPPPSIAESTSPLLGTSIALKDNICTNDDLPTSCASSMLGGMTKGDCADVGYVSPFDATVVSLLKASGATIAGKTNMDEFAMGSTSTNNLISVINPHRGQNGEELSAGGSSGGSAAAIAAGLVWGYSSWG